MAGTALERVTTVTVTYTIELYSVHPFTPDSAKSKIDKFFSKITNWIKLENKLHRSKVLLNSFLMNDHTLGFCPELESKVRKLCITH